MKFRQAWYGRREGEREWFPAHVPGNIQKDYGDAHGWGDLQYADNAKRYIPLEDDAWEYRAALEYQAEEGEKVYFVTGGIDYAWTLTLNGEKLLAHEGMFTPVEVDLTELLKQSENDLRIQILPHPKNKKGEPQTRQEANACCKPPVSYGWDWHPRLIPSGIWNDAYIETRKEGYIRLCEPFYELEDVLARARVSFDIQCDKTPVIELYDPAGTLVYKGTETSFEISGVLLWWCNGQGEANLYRWRAYTETDEKTGTIGFRSVQLVKNEGTWEEGEGDYPMTRSTPPATVCLNGRRIFAKGSNWVNPEIFTGTVTKETYLPLVRLAKEANMNIFRCWGGAGCNKESFYDLCDEMGILVWQEFPLACNRYEGTAEYLNVLEQEARGIVRSLRKHPCLCLWCGGNELFNSWSGMTDQDLAIRLLNKICYEEDRKTPFLPTSPLMGMAHGGYTFCWKGQDVFQIFQRKRCTAYTEFGVSSLAEPAYLAGFIPQEQLFPPREEGLWQFHQGTEMWGGESWLCLSIIEKYFGKLGSLEEIYEASALLQCEGYKAIFEEARRQKPYCSMALNWCYNEPWKIPANNSVISYPAIPKKGYYAVKDALRPVMPSAKIEKFLYEEGELFSCELWLLNDTYQHVSDTVHVLMQADGKETPLLVWNTGESEENRNVRGHKVQFAVPACKDGLFTLILKGEKYGESRYTLRSAPQKG